MPEDSAGASTATDSAGQDTQPQDVATTAPAAGQDGGTPAPGVDDRSAEDLLADAIGQDGGDSQDGGGEDALKAAQAEAARWREQARKQEKRAKENADKAKNFDAYQESQKTEAQKQAEALEAAQREAAEAKSYNWRLMAAVSYDLDAELMGDLQGSTEEEVNASAERLAAAINKRAEQRVEQMLAQRQNGTQHQAGSGYQRPVESLRPGALPAGDSKPRTPEQWLRDQLAKR